MSYPTPQPQKDNQGAYPIFYGSGLHTEYTHQSQRDQSTEYYTVAREEGNQANYPGSEHRPQNQSTDPSDPVPSDVINTTSQPDDVTNGNPLQLSSSNVQCEIVNARY